MPLLGKFLQTPSPVCAYACLCVYITMSPTLCEFVKHGHGLFNEIACVMMLCV